MAEFTAENRICEASFESLGPNDLLLRGMSGVESISKLFRFELDLVSPKPDIAFDSVVGKPVSLRLTLEDGGTRYFHGLVAKFAQAEAQGRMFTYTAEVVPWLWFLTRSRDCRIFQNMKVEDIIKDVFNKHGFADFKINSNTSTPHAYCVQWEETDFAFVSRLCEEAGIGYFFEYGEKAHTAVFFDSPDVHEDCPHKSQAKYTQGSAEGVPTGDIVGWDVERSVPTDIYTIGDFDYGKPSNPLQATTNFKDASSVAPIKLGKGHSEVYEYHAGEFTANPDGDKIAKLRMEALEAASFSIHSDSRCGAFTAGYCFELVGHYRKEYDDKYLLTRVTHHLTQAVGDESDLETSYVNSIDCIPHSIPFRPLCETPRPLIYGVQTATVTGKGGEEIDVDDQGRVVVQFHWDRNGKKDENSSCRVRVSQNWAGAQWGAIFHPRIGQEVLVEFINGDPDRPIITGRVYNGDKKVPYELPANSTQSGVKSRSSKGGANDNFNEIRFEDKKGEEELFIQAEKDQKINVKNDKSETVGHDRSRSVGNDETIKVEKNRGMSIGEMHTVDVGADHVEKVGGKETLSVEKDRDRSVTGKETVGVGKDQMISVKANQTVEIAKNHTLKIDADQSRTVGGKHQSDIAKGYGVNAQEVQFVAEKKITLKTGSAQIIMESNGNITIKGAKITIKGSGAVTVKGSNIKEN